MKQFLILFTVIFIYVFTGIQCSTSTKSGGGSEIGNGMLLGCVVDTSGKPSSHTQMMLIHSEYNPYTDSAISYEMIVLTDSLGNYEIPVKESGIFSIEGVHLVNGTRLLRTGIEIQADTITEINSDTLRPHASLKIRFPDSLLQRDAYIYIPGTTIYHEIEISQSQVVLDSIPAGTLPVLRYAQKGSTGFSEIQQNIITIPGDTVSLKLIPYYSKKLFLNTSSTGADIASTITSFPVLVRLDRNNFHFNEAENDGSDLRFTREESKSLPYEIEQWDRVNNNAVIWVNVDTIKGNNDTQYITMHWGDSEIALHIGTGAVFDTSAGYEGVWHLSGYDNGRTPDATANEFVSTSVNVTAEQGMIGSCGRFAGNGYVTIENSASGELNFPQNGRFTISAWVNSDNVSSSKVIVGKCRYQYHLEIYRSTWNFTVYQDNRGWDFTDDPYSYGEWVHVCGVRKDSLQTLYVNGSRVDNTISRNTDAADRIDTFDVEIGRGTLADGSHDFGFLGLIDEVQISSKARSEDWIRLNYINQKKDNLFLLFEE